MSDKQEIKFNSINASSLFHYTKELSTFELILKNGVRYSYAFEKYPQSVISNFCKIGESSEELGVAIPMASFCDIPITRAGAHRDKYGNYMIGFDKTFMIKNYGNILNPLLYVESPNLLNAIYDLSCIYKESSDEHQTLVASNTENNTRIPTLGLRKYNLRLLIGLTKPMFSENGDKCFYDEREWRAFNDDNKGQFNEWVWGITEKQYKRRKNTLNKRISSNFDGYITFYEDYLQKAITHVVVQTEDEIPKLAQFIIESPKLLGFEGVSVGAKFNLISKITSIERIALDY